MSCWWMSFKSFNKSFISKKDRKKFARSTACRRYLTRLSRKKDGAGASGSSSSITTNFRVSLGSRNRFFRCLWTKQRIFCGLAIFFSWTRGMSSPFSHWSRSVTRSGSSVTRGLFSAWSSSSLRHDGQPHKADDRRRRTSCESKTLQAQSNAIAAPIRKAFIFNQLMHALLLSFCRYFAKIADARGAMSLSLVKCQVKKFLSAACPQGAYAEAPFCVTMTVAIEFHSRALIRAHVRSRRHFAKLPLPNSRDKWGLCALRHGIQISMEAILACHPVRLSEWLDCNPKSCDYDAFAPAPLPYPDPYPVVFCHSAIHVFHPNTPLCLVFLSGQTGVYNFTKKMEKFRADLEKFQEMCEDLNFLKF